jgi:hypothetical protein
MPSIWPTESPAPSVAPSETNTSSGSILSVRIFWFFAGAAAVGVVY